jgi:hypothetical protein
MLDGPALEPNRPLCWWKRPGNDIKQSGLSGTVGADNRFNNSSFDPEIKVAKRHETAKSHDYLLYFQNIFFFNRIHL